MSLYVLEYLIPCRTPKEILDAAEQFANSHYGRGSYHFMNNNCQDFAGLCSIGKPWSADMEKLADISWQAAVKQPILYIKTFEGQLQWFAHEEFENQIGESEKWNNRDIKGACWKSIFLLIFRPSLYLAFFSMKILWNRKNK